MTGGYRTGWFRAILYNQNTVELARSTGNASGMGEFDHLSRNPERARACDSSPPAGERLLPFLAVAIVTTHRLIFRSRTAVQALPAVNAQIERMP